MLPSRLPTVEAGHATRRLASPLGPAVGRIFSPPCFRVRFPFGIVLCRRHGLASRSRRRWRCLSTRPLPRVSTDAGTIANPVPDGPTLVSNAVADVSADVLGLICY